MPPAPQPPSVIKRNYRQLYEELTWFFDTPPLLCDAPWWEVTMLTKGHGRVEPRYVTWSADLDGYLAWPGVPHMLRRACERIALNTGNVRHTMT